jgi:hypothetical protein
MKLAIQVEAVVFISSRSEWLDDVLLASRDSAMFVHLAFAHCILSNTLWMLNKYLWDKQTELHLLSGLEQLISKVELSERKIDEKESQEDSPN